MRASELGTFMTLKIVVCIGSDGFEDVFSDDGPGWRRRASDVDVGPNGCERANVAGSGIRREKYVEWASRWVRSEVEL